MPPYKNFLILFFSYFFISNVNAYCSHLKYNSSERYNCEALEEQKKQTNILEKEQKARQKKDRDDEFKKLREQVREETRQRKMKEYREKVNKESSPSEIPEFEDYGTNAIAISKYINDMKRVPIEVCKKAYEKKVASGAYCVSLQSEGENRMAALKDAANMGHLLAKSDLAYELAELNLPELNEKIQYLYLSSAKAGNPYSQVSVGWWYRTGGHGFEIDYEKSMQWFLKGYNQGIAKGAGNIASLYENGLGVKKDLRKAKTWNKRASVLESCN